MAARNGVASPREGTALTDDKQWFPPESWSVERPFDFGDFLNREPPTYEDEDELGDGTDHADEQGEPPVPPKS